MLSVRAKKKFNPPEGAQPMLSVRAKKKFNPSGRSTTHVV